MSRRPVALIAALAMSAPGGAVARPPRYVYVDIGVLNDVDPVSNAQAVNSAGEATGGVFAFGTRADGSQRLTLHAYRFTPETGLIDIGDAPGIDAGLSRGFDINESGVIAGEVDTPDVVIPAPPPFCTTLLAPPAIWANDTALFLPVGEHMLGGEALGINASGHAVGWMAVFSDDDPEIRDRAFVWDGATLRFLEPLLDINAKARDINNAGDIVGRAIIGNQSVGFLIRDGEFINLHETTGLLIGSAERVNNAGQVFGRSHAGFYLWDDGETAVLEQTPRPSLMYDLNDHGDMVGGNGDTAFLWSEGRVYDLVDLINGGVPPEFQLSRARGISNRMHIVGEVRQLNIPITPRGFYLEPVTPDLTADGVVDAADLSRLLGKFGTADPRSDLDGDGSVNGLDLARVLNQWGPVPARDAHAAFLKYKEAERRRAEGGAGATPRAGARR